jgi:hypothetical protein
MALISGCVASSSMMDLKRDTPIAPERSVVFWKLRITDKTGTIALPGKEAVPAMYIHRLDVANYGSSHSVYPHIAPDASSAMNAEKNIKQSEGIHRYEQMMAVSLDPGRYQIKSIRFRIDSHTRFSLPVNRLLRAMSGKLYYIGSFNIIVHNKSNGELSYTFDIDYDTKKQEDMDRFVSLFPKLSNGPGNKPILNRLSAYHVYDFSYDITAFPEFIRTDEVLAEINIEKNGRSYIIQRFTDNEDTTFITNKRIHPLSNKDSFTLEWESKWVDGVNHLPYGLLLGSDPVNAYYFSASGNRKSAVFLKKNNRWLTNPCNWKETVEQRDPGSDSDNYKVVFSNNRIVYSVNKRKIAEFNNELQFKSFMIGLFVSGKESIIFDSIIIEQKPGSVAITH